MLFAIAGAVVLLDQWTKSLVRTYLPEGTVYRPDLWITQYARILHTQNTGAAFGLFKSFGGVFMILSIVVSFAILYYFPHVPRRDWPLRAAMCLQLGGALGNLIDRLTQNFVVTDFISIGTFPVFNVADASISVGVAVLVLGMWMHDIQEKRAGRIAQANAEPPAPEAAPSALPEEPQGE